MTAIRNSAKAIIVEQGKLLAVKLRDKDGDWYTLPGGGQEPGEPIHETLRRECREEISADVVIEQLRYVRDLAGVQGIFPFNYGDVHVIEFMFTCRFAEGSVAQMGAEPDTEAVGLEWLDIYRLDSYRLYPIGLRTLMQRHDDPDMPVYIAGVGE
ncbi:MAG: NUDIX domain-containing protein [Chloroflexota bacterium]